jgi:hypothetical protein
MRGAAVLVGALLLTGCSAPTTDPAALSSPAPSATATASSSPVTPSPTPTPGFTIPATCDGLLPADTAASFASQGLVGGEVAAYLDAPIGAPIPLSGFDINDEADVVMTDYLNCEWVGGGRLVDIFVGRLDAVSRAITVDDFGLIDSRVDRTARVLLY